MDLNSHRRTRFMLIKDSIAAIGARLGDKNTDAINDTPIFEHTDGYHISISAINGVGRLIRRIIKVIVLDDETGHGFSFDFDVVGNNQCRNVKFHDFKEVDEVADEDWDFLKFIPELFADYVTEIIYPAEG
jgi:hypothetical protein